MSRPIRRAFAPALVLAISACAAAPSAGGGGAPAPRPARPVPAAPASPPSPVRPPPIRPEPAEAGLVAEVGDRAIRTSDVGDFLLRYYREAAREIVVHLVDEEIIDREADRLQVSLAPEFLHAEVDRELADRETKVKVEYGAEATLSGYVEDVYGVGLPAFRADLLRLLRTRLLRDRVLRLHGMVVDRIQVREAVLPSAEDARRAAEAARAGADLAKAAAEFPGGASALRPLAGRDYFPAAVARALFRLTVGEVAGPMETVDGFSVYKIVLVRPARAVTWASARDEIEAGLRERPVEAAEYAAWSREMRNRYGVAVHRVASRPR